MKLSFHAYKIKEIRNPVLSPFFQIEGDVIKSDQLGVEFNFKGLEGADVLKDVFQKGDYDRVSSIQDLLNVLAEAGFIKEKSEVNRISGVNICHDLYHEMREEIFKYYKDGSFIYNLLEKRVTQGDILKWIKKCFQYTYSAERHISSVVDNSKLSEEEKEFWVAFRADEKFHWGIYSSVCSYLNLDIEKLKLENNVAVEDFISFLCTTGARSPYEYAALLFMMELPPTVENIEDDPQFGSLINIYNFPKSSIEPLFQHSAYNEKSNHCEIWYNVLRSRDDYTLKESKDILLNAKKHCELAYLWNKI
jgi:hypothetical protein